MKHLTLPVPRNISIAVLLATLFTCAYAVVLPSLRALQSMPGYYYHIVSASNTPDSDADGIPDGVDFAAPSRSVHAAAPVVAE